MILKKCVECGSYDTRTESLETMTMGIDEVRSCNECKTQFVNELQIVTKKVIG